MATYMDNDVETYVDHDMATNVDDDVAAYMDDKVTTDVKVDHIVGQKFSPFNFN
jgi:hypothetical protein